MSKIVNMNSYSIGQQKKWIPQDIIFCLFRILFLMHTGLRAVAGQGSRPPEMLKVTSLKYEFRNHGLLCGGRGIGIWPLGEKKEAENRNRGSRVPSWKLDSLRVYILLCGCVYMEHPIPKLPCSIDSKPYICHSCYSWHHSCSERDK